MRAANIPGHNRFCQDTLQFGVIRQDLFGEDTILKYIKFILIMKVYFGGQIREDARGNRALIITHDDCDTKQPWSVFLYRIGSEDYNYLTGVGSVKMPLERAYVGVSYEGTDFVTIGGVNSGELSLESIDRKLVYPHFLPEEPETSKK